MTPTDAQRGALLIHELGAMERDLTKLRQRALRLSVILRDDALGVGTRAALNGLIWNGRSLADQANRGTYAKIDLYRVDESAQTELVAAHVSFAPDVIVLAGSGDAVNELMAPIEQRWGSGPRPEYMLIDSAKVPDLLALASERTDLAARILGTGTTPSPQSLEVHREFLLNYTARHPHFDEASSAGVGTSYDATYAIAYAIVAAGADLTGRGIAAGLRRLDGGDALKLGPTHILGALRRLSSGETIAAVGTYSALRWDAGGAIASGPSRSGASRRSGRSTRS